MREREIEHVRETYFPRDTGTVIKRKSGTVVCTVAFFRDTWYTIYFHSRVLCKRNSLSATGNTKKKEKKERKEKEKTADNILSAVVYS